MDDLGDRVAWTIVLALALLSAGCIGMSGDASLEPADTQTDEDPQSSPGNMTVERTEETADGMRENVPPFYSSRIVTIEGDLTLERLPIDLATDNGPITVEIGAEDRYQVVANLTGYGLTPQTAEENRDDLSFTFDAGQPGDRQLFAHIEREDDDQGPVSTGDGGFSEGSLTLTLPPSLVADLVASSTNGEVDVDGITADRLELGSTNGDVSAGDTQASDVVLETTNGDIDAAIIETQNVVLGSTNGHVDATIRPGESGTIEASSTNGDLGLAVPEDAEHGYQAEAASTNGEVDIRLEDGSGEHQESTSSERGTFRTDGFDQRPIRTAMALSSTNGDVELAPA